MSRLAPRFHIEFRADAPDEFRRAAFRGKHPAQKKQIARLHRFHIGAKRLRRRRKLDAEFFQPLLGARRREASWLPFANVRTAVHVQHLPSHLAGFRQIEDRATMSFTSETRPIGCSVFR